MPDVPFVFISSTTRDLEAERKQVAHWVNQHGCYPVVQHTFAGEPDNITIRALLEEKLKSCAAVIHLCGFYFGSGPKDASPPISYTRMEYEYGKDNGLPVMVLLADEAKYLPLCPDQTKDNAKLQRGYYDGFKASPGTRYSFKDIKDLEGTVTSFLKKHGVGTETSAPPHNLPFSSIGEKFVGREQVMEDLAQSLEKGAGAAALTSVAAVHALGGLGKTRVAIEHAWHSRDRYTALLFVKAASPLLPAGDATPAVVVDPLMSPVASLSNVLKLGIEATEEAAHYQAVLDWFHNHRNWLLIIDNVDTKEAQIAVNALLPRLTNGHTLITSRLSTWSGAVKPLEIGILADADGTALILLGIGIRPGFSDTEAAATVISRELGGHALALQQAAAYILRSRISLEKYLEKWKTQRDELLKRTELPPDYPLTVSATLEITFAELSTGARFLLDALSFFASTPIPRYVVESIALPDGADTAECLLELFDWHMAESGERGTTVAVHGLVQGLIYSRLDEGSEEGLLEAAISSLKRAVFGKDPQDASIWPILEPLVPHLLEVAEQTTSTSEAEDLFNKAGAFYHAKAQHAEAEAIYRHIIFINQNIADEDNFNVARSLNNLANLLHETNRHREAEPLYLKALQITEHHGGENHDLVAICLSNLGRLFQETNRPHLAELQYRRAIAIAEDAGDDSHPHLSSYLSNLGGLLNDSNRSEEAEVVHRRAVAIDIKHWGDDHPNIATGLNNLAELLLKKRQFPESESLLRRSLRIHEQHLGMDHPLVATVANNLAMLLNANDRTKDAEQLLRRSLEITERFLGNFHPNVAIVLNNIAEVLQKTNRYQEAEPLSRRQLRILISFSKRTGHNHPQLLNAFNNYTALLFDLGLEEERTKDRINRLFAEEEIEDLPLTCWDRGIHPAPGNPDPRHPC